MKYAIRQIKTMLYKNLFDFRQLFRKANHPKIFIIGRNKTGTTSLTHEFKSRGFKVGKQWRAELLLDDYINGDFKKIIKYARKAKVFQDIPFSYPETFKHLDKAYPNSKFILTVRDSPEQWYKSITNFHSKKFGKGKLPTKQDLKQALYVKKGWIWKANRTIYDSPEDNPYEKEALIKSYVDHNRTVKNYFKNRDNFLIINIADKDAYIEFCNFLDIPTLGKTKFPWKNRTKDQNIK